MASKQHNAGSNTVLCDYEIGLFRFNAFFLHTHETAWPHAWLHEGIRHIQNVTLGVKIWACRRFDGKIHFGTAIWSVRQAYASTLKSQLKATCVRYSTIVCTVERSRAQRANHHNIDSIANINRPVVGLNIFFYETHHSQPNRFAHDTKRGINAIRPHCFVYICIALILYLLVHCISHQLRLPFIQFDFTEWSTHNDKGFWYI